MIIVNLWWWLWCLSSTKVWVLEELYLARSRELCERVPLQLKIDKLEASGEQKLRQTR